MKRAWHSVSAEEALRNSKSSRTGLSSKQASDRLKIYGPNQIEKSSRKSALKLLLDQFTSPLVWVLIFAAILTAILRDWIDFYVILVVIVANALFGFWQEFKAESSIEALKKLVALKATVFRDGKKVQVPADEVVPGDVLVLETGDKVSADARIIDTTNLATLEAALTGESLPIKKVTETLEEKLAIGDRKNMVFAGTEVTNGRAHAVVTDTGMRTQVGKIARLLHDTEDDLTPIQVQLKKLALQLTGIVLLVAVVVVGVDLLLGKAMAEVLKKGIALAVAAIPEGLPAVVTITFALGVQAMAKKNALMRRLPSVETLGACTVICTDKTGTLTMNQMTVKKLFVDGQVISVSGAGYVPRGEFSDQSKGMQELLRIGALNNNAQLNESNNKYSILGDPTEGALLVSAAKAGMSASQLKVKAPRIHEIEFSSVRKRMTTVHREGSSALLKAYTKGAPEVVLPLCSRILINGQVRKLTANDKTVILKNADEFANQALRVLGFAYNDVASEDAPDEIIEKGMIFVGLQAMIDPPRKEVKRAIQLCRSAGIKVIMITGDHIATAKAIGKEIGLTGKAIRGVNISAINLAKEVEDIAIFARVDPEHKLRIIQALRQRGHVVAMTGDGANDAPALKKADLGIAMGIAGTDVAREASDMVLADDNFSTIVSAVEHGRIVYDNIRKFVMYLLSGNAGEVFTIFTATIMGLMDPLTAKQILWINLVTDLFPATSLALDPKEPGVMSRSPRKVGEKILTRYRIIRLLITGAVIMSGTLFVFNMYNPAVNLAKAQTMAFCTLVFSQFFNSLNQRSETDSIFKLGFFSNKWLLLGISVSATLQVICVQTGVFNTLFNTTPLVLTDWLVVLGVGSVVLVFGEIIKVFRRM